MADGPDIEIIEERHDDALILRPIGDIDLSCAPSLRTHLNRAMKDAPARLIIDLTEVPYMDSSGVATFVEAMQHARRAGTELILCCLQERVQSVFEIARLDMVFTIMDTLEETR